MMHEIHRSRESCTKIAREFARAGIAIALSEKVQGHHEISWTIVQITRDMLETATMVDHDQLQNIREILDHWPPGEEQLTTYEREQLANTVHLAGSAAALSIAIILHMTQQSGNLWTLTDKIEHHKDEIDRLLPKVDRSDAAINQEAVGAAKLALKDYEETERMRRASCPVGLSNDLKRPDGNQDQEVDRLTARMSAGRQDFIIDRDTIPEKSGELLVALWDKGTIAIKRASDPYNLYYDPEPVPKHVLELEQYAQELRERGLAAGAEAVEKDLLILSQRQKSHLLSVSDDMVDTLMDEVSECTKDYRSDWMVLRELTADQQELMDSICERTDRDPMVEDRTALNLAIDLVRYAKSIGMDQATVSRVGSATGFTPDQLAETNREITWEDFREPLRTLEAIKKGSDTAAVDILCRNTGFPRSHPELLRWLSTTRRERGIESESL